jgi:hypothetical protein
MGAVTCTERARVACAARSLLHRPSRAVLHARLLSNLEGQAYCTYWESP